MSNHQESPGSFTDRTAKWIRWLAVPIVLFWLVVAGITNALVPQLEVVGEAHNVALSSPDSPSLQAFKRIGDVFKEFDSDSAAMVVLEGDQPLGADAHRYYDELIQRISQDHKHVQHVQDFWGDPLTAAGSQSADGKAAYVQVFLAGNQGEAQSIESVDAVRDIVNNTPAPSGVKAYLTGAAPQVTDQFEVGNEGTTKVTVLTVLVIAVMLLFVYRSVVTMILVLVTVLIEMSAARGIVAFLGNSGVIGLSTYATNILTLLVIAAGTDYAIFLLGRYHEDRSKGQDRETAYYNMYRGTSHVILGSGLTVAGAVFCLSFTRNSYFQSLGIPAAIGVLVALLAALTLAPAVLTIGSRFGLLEPKRKARTRGWRRIGTAIVRWPGPILVATLAVAAVGLLALPGYKTSYDISRYMPDRAPSNVGYAAAERHFSKARLNPELLMIETDHDLRNPTDMILLERVAKAVFHTSGVAQVQSITRPWARRSTTRRFRFRSARKAPVRYRTWDTSRTAPTICSSRSTRSTRRSAFCGSRPPCSNRRTTQRTNRLQRFTKPLPWLRTCVTRSPISTTSSGRCATTSIGSHTVTTSRSAGRCDRCSMRSTGSTR